MSRLFWDKNQSKRHLLPSFHSALSTCKQTQIEHCQKHLDQALWIPSYFASFTFRLWFLPSVHSSLVWNTFIFLPDIPSCLYSAQEYILTSVYSACIQYHAGLRNMDWKVRNVGWKWQSCILRPYLNNWVYRNKVLVVMQILFILNITFGSSWMNETS